MENVLTAHVNCYVIVKRAAREYNAVMRILHVMCVLRTTRYRPGIKGGWPGQIKFMSR